MSDTTVECPCCRTRLWCPCTACKELESKGVHEHWHWTPDGYGMVCPTCGFTAHEDWWWFPEVRVGDHE